MSDQATHNCIGNPCWICFPAYAPEASKRVGKAGDGAKGRCSDGGRAIAGPTTERQPSEPADPLRESIEKAMRKAWGRETICGNCAVQFTKMQAAAVSVAVRLVEEEREKVWALEINAEESDECAADLFALVCTVLDNKPEAVDARKQLQSHIDHVRACRKGSCRTELYGSRQRERAEAAEKALAEYRKKWGHVAGRCDCRPCRALPTDIDYHGMHRDPRCAPEGER